MGNPRISSKKGEVKHLVCLLVSLTCWGVSRLSSPFYGLVMSLDKKQTKEDAVIASIYKAKNNDTNATITLLNRAGITASTSHPNFTFDFPMCLVHVGKAAGSSLSCGLGLMYADCEGMPRDPPLPNTFYFHLKKDTCRRVGHPDPAKNTVPIATYLLPVRNPLTRIQSWFHFEKDIVPIRQNKREENHFKWKRGMLFVECYDNFVDLVMEGLTPRLLNTTVLAERPANMTCQERAWAAVMGVREFSYHEWYNYEYYWTALHEHHPRLFSDTIQNKSLNSPASLVVLRTEFLSDDWSEISKEELFRPVNRGSRKEFRTTQNNSTIFSSRAESEQHLGQDRSSKFWRNLCRAMCPEIQIYKQILDHATNLNHSQVAASLHGLQQLCPEENNTVRTCPEMPKFPLMQVPRRQYKNEIKKRLFTT
jgi:hypothetical protein